MQSSNGRMLPHDKDAEISVLGSIFHNPNTLSIVKGWLTPESFFSPAHRDIYAAMLTLDTKNEIIDEVTVIHQLRFQGKLDACGGMPYIAEMVDLTPPGMNIKEYAGIVAETETRRGELVAASGFVQEGGGAEKAYDLRQSLETLSARHANREATTLKEAVAQGFDVIERRADRFASLILTHTCLDEHLSGLAPGYVTIVGARTSHGKSAFVAQVALENARRGVPTLFVTLEMPHHELGLRMVAYEGKINNTQLLKGHAKDITDAEWDRASAASATIGEFPLYFAGRGRAMTLDAIGNMIRSYIYEEGVQLVVIDHLRKIAVSKSEARDLYDKQTLRIETLSEMAKEVDIPFLVAAQINRQGAETPQMKDLEGSGIIEQEADVVLILHLPEDEEGQIKVVGDKVRNGRRFEKNLQWNGPHLKIGPYPYLPNQNPGQGELI